MAACSNKAPHCESRSLYFGCSLWPNWPISGSRLLESALNPLLSVVVRVVQQGLTSVCALSGQSGGAAVLGLFHRA